MNPIQKDRTMTLTKMFALAAAAALLPASVFAQSAPVERSGCCAKESNGQMGCCEKDADGEMNCCAKMKAKAATQGDTADRSTMDHSTMDHGAMDHSAMDQGAIDRSTMDHGSMTHGAMHHGSMAHPPATAEPKSPRSADQPGSER